MCLKQNLEAAKLCRVERQMTEEGIIFSIYSCLHLLFLHVLSFSFCIRLDDVFRYEENYSNCLDPLKTQFVIKLPVQNGKILRQMNLKIHVHKYLDINLHQISRVLITLIFYQQPVCDYIFYLASIILSTFPVPVEHCIMKRFNHV